MGREGKRRRQAVIDGTEPHVIHKKLIRGFRNAGADGEATIYEKPESVSDIPAMTPKGKKKKTVIMSSPGKRPVIGVVDEELLKDYLEKNKKSTDETPEDSTSEPESEPVESGPVEPELSEQPVVEPETEKAPVDIAARVARLKKQVSGE